MSADRFNLNKNFEQIQTKHIGTGNSDLSKFDWATNQHRDSIASHVAHHDMLTYFAVAQGTSTGRVKYQLYEKLIQPCGLPPQPVENNRLSSK